MENCIFCKIVKGEIPNYKVYEDNLFLGFLDIRPRTLGHSLLIPKKHYQWVYDVPQFEKYWAAVFSITKAMQKSLCPSFVSYATHGLEIPHAHIHIMPRISEKAFVPPEIHVSKIKMQEVSTKIFKETNLNS